MNILTAINRKYMPYFATMIRSLADSNGQNHTVYVVTKEVTDEDIDAYKKQGKLPENMQFTIVRFDDSLLKNAPTLKKWPTEIYYRIFACFYLPKDIDRILYLDGDIIINGNISELYNFDFNGNLFVATTNIHNKLFKRIIQIKNGAKRKTVYANTGVLLMNLESLRKEQTTEEVLSYIRKRKAFLSLPDQDVISTLYGERIGIVDNMVYNLSEREIRHQNRRRKNKIDEKWVAENCKIIHYLSQNKPWKPKYKGILKPWWDKYKTE